MGCCESCLPSDSNEFDSDAQRERDPLLRDGNTSQTVVEINSESHVTPIANSQPRGDEQSALNRILHKTASNVIDVAGVDSRGMEQHEYHDKARQYSNRVNMVLSSTGRAKHYKTALPNGVSAPQIHLASHPISTADIELISAVALKASQAMNEVKVAHKEDLVVPFGVP